jgi:hypothetical protein
MKNIGLNYNRNLKSVNNGICSDCIFWYQCRQGKVDCPVKNK